MTLAQKVIKYLAIAFAIFLIITIISGILSAFYVLSGVLGLKNDTEETLISGMSTSNFESNYIEILDIDVAYTNLTIKTGDSFKVETNNNNINFKQTGEKLSVEEKGHKWFNNNDELIIYIPKDLEFEKVKINAGAGKVNIERIDTKNLSFKLGAGATSIESLKVSNDCNIEGGAGRVDILSGKINNLDLDMGIGETKLTSNITGKSNIDAGIGKVQINIQGSKEDYKIKVDKGVGSIKIEGMEVDNESTYGEGKNYIDIDGGIGSININFDSMF